MKRREFMSLLIGGAAAWPLATRAQQPGKVWRVGFFSGTSRSAVSELYAGFVRGMAELGYAEGKNFVIEWRSAEDKYERIPEIAAEFVRLNVDVIVTAFGGALPTLKREVTTIPIVMAYSVDPVGNGIVASLVRPGGNITGLAGSSDDSSPKQLELVTTVAPNASRVGVLGNPNNKNYPPMLKSVQTRRKKLAFLLHQ